MQNHFHGIRPTSIMFLMGLSITYGQVLHFPYEKGKQANSFNISLKTNSTKNSPDSIQVGSLFTIVPYFAPSMLTVCNNRSEFGLKILIASGQANGTLGKDTNWNGYSQYPTSIIVLDSVPKLMGTCCPYSNGPKALGYVFATPGDFDCRVQTYSLEKNYGQVIFFHQGNTYGKIKIMGYLEERYMVRDVEFSALLKINVRYLISDNINDLVDDSAAVAIHPLKSSKWRPDLAPVFKSDAKGRRIQPLPSQPYLKID